MMKQWIRFLCLSLLSIVTGIASAEDVIEISTVQGLKEFRDAVNSGTNYAGKTVELTNDLDLQGQNWVPIGIGGGTSKSFCGTFDGKGHTISNLSCNYQKYAGLFGSFYGIVKNLTMKDVNMVSTHYAGGIVAFLGSEAGKNITNCTVSGGTISSVPELVNDSYDNGDKVGGILGYMAGKDYVANCIVENVTIKGYRDLGGIVGMANGTSSVSGCSATNITIIQDNENGYKSYAEVKDLAGGIVGRASANATVSDNTSSNITITHVNYGVAKIGDVEYETIAAAVAAANEGNVIQIIKAGDYTLPTLSKNVTIEGKADGVVSFTHTTAGSVASIPNGATFKNVTFNFGNVNYHGFQHAGTINMEGCTLNGLLFSYSDMNFTNCTFGQSNKDYHMWCYAGNVTYNNCKFTNSATGKFLNIYNEDGATKYTVTVNNCKFVNQATSANKAALNVKATCGAKLLTYDVIINECTTEGAFPAAGDNCVEGGKITGIVVNPLVQVDDRTADGADNIKVYEKDKLIYPVSYVAQIEGGAKFESLEAAFAAATDGATITLLADCAGNGIKAPQGKFTTGLTVDFAGHTYTVDGSTVGSTGTETNAFQLLKDNKITFKNGTITSEKAKILVQNYSDLTLEGMTLTLNNANYTSAYTLSNNNGNIVIDGTTINANPAGGFAFDVCRYSSYPSVGVTVKGESKINGDIEVSASKSDAKDGFSLMLESCTLTGEIVLDATAKAAMAATPEKATVSKSNSLETIAAPEEYKWKDNGNNTSSLVQKTYVAKIGDVKYETLREALDEAKNNENIVVELLADAVLDVTAWSGEKNALSIGSANTKTITINGNSHQLTFNNKNSDWNNIATMNDAETKLILNDMAITNSGHNEGTTWNRHDINFNCAVELNNVTSDKALAFKNKATIKNVTITETAAVYGIWIQSNGQKVSIEGLNLTAERGIKIDEQYVDNPGEVTLDIANATFNTTKKAAILVKSTANTVITAGEGINIANVAADKDNLVWVDEDRAEEFYKVTVNNATIMPEPRETDYVACLLNGEKRWGYYKNLSKAIDKVEEGYSIRLHQTTDEAVVVSKLLTITKNGYTADNVTAGEGYMRLETEKEIVICEYSDPVLKDWDEEYAYPKGMAVNKVTYLRTFKEGQVGNYQAWYVPFDYTITADDVNDFKFYRISMIAAAAEAGTVDNVESVYIYLQPVGEGTVLKANRPYVVVPNQAVTAHEFVAENIEKLYPIDATSRLNEKTTHFYYDFYGNYKKQKYAANEIYAMNGGKIALSSGGNDLGTYRWYIKTTAISDDYAKPNIMVVGDGEDVDGINNGQVSCVEIQGIYTLGGVKVEHPVKGVNIIKYTDGRTKKINVK